MLRSDYCSDYERQKSEFQNSIATIVATTLFIDRFEWPKQREGIYKEKKIEISLLSCPRLLAGRQALAASRQERKHRLLVPKGSLQGEPCPQHAACGRRKERRAEESV